MLVVSDEIGGTASDEAVINVDGEDGNVIAITGGKHAGIGVVDSESNIFKGAAQSVVPFAPGLFEAIEGLVEVLDLLPLIVVAGGRLHINIFVVIEFAIEVGAIEVESVGVPVVSGCDCENESEAGEFGNGGKGVKVVDAKFLCESLRNEARLVFFDGSVGLSFDAENPFAANNILAGGLGYYSPSACFFKCGEFMIHGFAPFWPVGMGSGLSEGFWVVVGFSHGSFKELLIVCKVNEVEGVEVGGKCAGRAGVRPVWVHPTALCFSGRLVEFFTCDGFASSNAGGFLRELCYAR